MNFKRDDLEDILYSLEGYLQANDDSELCERLEDICYRIERKLSDYDVIDSQQLEGDISTVKDSDYAECVDSLVDRLESTKDNSQSQSTFGNVIEDNKVLGSN